MTDLKEITKTIIVSGIVINILGAVITCVIIFFKDKLRNILSSVKRDIELFLKFETEGILKNLKFGILHVMDGKDDIKDKDNLLNKVIWFKLIKKAIILVGLKNSISCKYKVRVSFNGRLGMQFKCFVDFKDIDFQEVFNILEQNSFADITVGIGKKNRVWFIHPEYEVHTTSDQIKNNFIYPQ